MARRTNTNKPAAATDEPMAEQAEPATTIDAAVMAEPTADEQSTPDADEQAEHAPDAEMVGSEPLPVDADGVPTTDEPTTEQATDEPEPMTAFQHAYWSAIGNADPATGTIPAVQSDALSIAYRKLGAKRAAIGQAEQTAEMGAALDGAERWDGSPIPDVMARLAALRAIGVILSGADVKQDRAPRVTIDPIAQALAQVTALRAAESFLLAGFTADEQSSLLADAEKIMAGKVDGYVIDWNAAGLPTRGGKKSGSVKRSASGADRAPAGSLGEAVLAALTAADGPMTAAQLNKACDRSGGAVPNAADRVAVRTTIKNGDRDVTAWVLA